MCQENEDEVPCEEEKGLCWITDKIPEDKDWPMNLNECCQYVVQCYIEIIGSSIRERIELTVEGGKKTKIIYLPSLDKLEMWMNFNDWNSSPVNEDEFFKMIITYHQSYTGFLIQK